MDPDPGSYSVANPTDPTSYNNVDLMDPDPENHSVADPTDPKRYNNADPMDPDPGSYSVEDLKDQDPHCFTEINLTMQIFHVLTIVFHVI